MSQKLYYKNDGDIAGDQELNNWWTEIRCADCFCNAHSFVAAKAHTYEPGGVRLLYPPVRTQLVPASHRYMQLDLR